MNIVLIITDCLRYDAFSKYMKIKQYAEKILNKAYSPVPNTFFAMPSLMIRYGFTKTIQGQMMQIMLSMALS